MWVSGISCHVGVWDFVSCSNACPLCGPDEALRLGDSVIPRLPPHEKGGQEGAYGFSKLSGLFTAIDLFEVT